MLTERAGVGICGAYEHKEHDSMIETEVNASDRTYGYRRITAGSGRHGVSAACGTVHCLMCQADLIAAHPRRKVQATTRRT